MHLFFSDNTQKKFKVINVDDEDDDGNELSSHIMELTDTELILYTVTGTL